MLLKQSQKELDAMAVANDRLEMLNNILMSKTLFLGDSHSHGYYEMGGKISSWQSNNYAEIMHTRIASSVYLQYALVG